MQAVSQGDARVGVVMSDGVMSDIVGPTPYLDVVVEGVPVKALVDSGSQSTLISRSMLHRVAAKLRAGGGQLPKLTLPTVKLYGKDGQSDKKELYITAQVELSLVSDVRVPVLVQPESEQECLLGMIAIPKLGIQLLRPNGKPVCAEIAQSAVDLKTSSVHLVQTSTIPGRKGRFVDVVADGSFNEGDEVLFEPDTTVLKELGLSSGESFDDNWA